MANIRKKNKYLFAHKYNLNLYNKQRDKNKIIRNYTALIIADSRRRKPIPLTPPPDFAANEVMKR